jgi:hypothetical protein
MVVYMLCHAVPCCAVCCHQDADWDFQNEAADDDLEQGYSEEEKGWDDDPGMRKEIGEHCLDIRVQAAGHGDSGFRQHVVGFGSRCVFSHE